MTTRTICSINSQNPFLRSKCPVSERVTKLIIADLIDKVPVHQLKIVIVILLIIFVTAGLSYSILSAKREQLRDQTYTRCDDMSEQIKQMHSVIYKPIGGQNGTTGTRNSARTINAIK